MLIKIFFFSLAYLYFICNFTGHADFIRTNHVCLKLHFNQTLLYHRKLQTEQERATFKATKILIITGICYFIIYDLIRLCK